MKCLNCGEYVTSNQVFCSFCGKINIICPKCGYIVSGDDSFCGKCGIKLSEVIETAKKKLEEKENREKEWKNQVFEAKKQKDLESEMKKYALDLIIECEGNKFKAIKELKGKYNIDNDMACEYINEVYDKIGNKTLENTSIEYNENNSIEEIVKRNNYHAINSIKEVKEIYGYDLKTAKERVDSIIEQSKLIKEYIDPNGIKKTIIVSQSSRKKATSAIGRGLIGGAIFGPVGLLAGTSAKSKETTTFQVIYNNGNQETITVKNGSWMFKEYCKYLDV